MRNFAIGLLVALTAFASACQSNKAHSRADKHAQPPQLFDGMGTHTRRITTNSPEAQQWFNQGFIWMYSFNHDEAIRSFREAARIDPNCAMAFWGIAISSGPHINLPIMDAERDVQAWNALREAMALRSRANPTERALIEALSRRYTNPAPADRAHLDAAYADAMRAVWARFPTDADVGALTAEAMMDLHPWNLWTIDGQPKEGAEEVVATLESVLRLDPNHPGAMHLYIHAVEASANPGRATAVADRLRNAVPASGHMVHMPGHIDVRTGQWAKAETANVRAMEVDRRYRELSPRQGFYNMYMAHNPHFLAYVCMMSGRSAAAMSAARSMLADIPDDFKEQTPAFADPFLGIAFAVQMRFGQWNDILKEPQPAKSFPYSRAMWRFARAVAYSSLNRLDDAERERRAFHEAVRAVPEGTLLGINPAHKVLAIADLVLDAEIDYRRGNIDDAVATLRRAVDLEGQLLYMEPPEWIQPVRHTLGAILVDAGRYSEAAEVYREDLHYWPENGWSLYGLARCLDNTGDPAEADRIRARFNQAWARADVKLNATCLCVAPAEPVSAR